VNSPAGRFSGLSSGACIGHVGPEALDEGPIGRVRWLVRYALMAFAATTIAAWFAFGARFELAYLSKAIELALIGLLLVDSWVVDGGPLVVVRRLERIAASAIR